MSRRPANHRPRRLCVDLAAAVACVGAVVSWCASAAADGPRVEVETVDDVHVGELVSLSPGRLLLQGDSFVDLPIDSVLRVSFEGRSGLEPAGVGRVTLVDGTSLRYAGYELQGDTLRLQSARGGFEATVPLAAVVGWSLDDAAIAIGESEQQPESASDTLWVRGRRRPQPKAVAGAILGLGAEAVRFSLDPESTADAIDVPWDRVAGMRFFRPTRSQPTARCVIGATDGSRIAAAEFHPGAPDEPELVWDADDSPAGVGPRSSGSIAWDHVAWLDLSAGRVTPIARLRVIDESWRPFFTGEVVSNSAPAGHRFDAALGGDPLSLLLPDPRLPAAWPGVAVRKEFRRGMAMRSDGAIVFALPADALRLKGLVGVDPATARACDAQVIMLADDRVLFEGDLDGASRPIEINASLRGAARLTLRVGFGDGLDTGDHVHFANFRVIQ